MQKNFYILFFLLFFCLGLGIIGFYFKNKSLKDQSSDKNKISVIASEQERQRKDKLPPPSKKYSQVNSGNIREENSPELQSSTKDKDAESATKTIDKMIEGQEDGLVQALIDLLKTGNNKASELAVDKLIEIGNEESVSQLLEIFPTLLDEELQRYIAGKISSIKNPATADILIEQLTTTDNNMLIGSLQSAIGRSLNDEVIGKLVELYQNTDDSRIKQILADVFRHADNPEYTADFIALLSDDACNLEDNFMNRAAVDTLGIIGTKEAISFLLDKLREDPESEFYSASIARCINLDSLPLFLSSAKNDNEPKEVRLSAIAALANYDSLSAIECLRNLISKESDPSIVQAAEKSIAKINK